MNTLQFMRHSATLSPVSQSLLKLNAAANQARSGSFAQYLNADLASTPTPANDLASQVLVPSQKSAASLASTTSNPRPNPTSTPGEVATRLLAANQPPAAESLDAMNGPLYSSAYMDEVNYNSFVNQTNLQNQKTLGEYTLDVTNWALNEGQREGLGLPSEAPPAAPQYLAVNAAGYDQWWSTVSNVAHFGNAPPVNFITPVSTPTQAVSGSGLLS
jgi:hypothetical protein